MLTDHTRDFRIRQAGLSGAVYKGFDVFILGIAVSEHSESIGNTGTKSDRTWSYSFTGARRRGSKIEDTSPLFLLGVGIFRKMTDEHDFLPLGIG